MVSVLDKNRKPLDPCTEKRARLLLSRGRARVHRIYPVFTIRLMDRIQEESEIHPLRLGIDPGSKTTGLALSMPLEGKEKALGLFELTHRGERIHRDLLKRKAFRRSRRNRKIRCREPRFDNRTRKEGWLAPSVFHRVQSTVNLVRKFQKLFVLGSINAETARFDTQKLQNPEISGIEYQQGTLQGWDVREYILWKFNHRCVYCGMEKAKFELDHVVPRSRGGSDRVSNLALACESCNRKKDDLSLETFCPEKAEIIKKQLQAPLRDAAAMNAVRFRLASDLKSLGTPVLTLTGSRTKFNRHRFNVPKEHCLDALFSGETRAVDGWKDLPVMIIQCRGRGSRSRTLLDRFGFPRARLPRRKAFFGFMTGDLVKAVVEKGKKAGEYMGRVAVRSTGYFNIDTGRQVVQGIGYRCLRLLQRGGWI